MMNLDGFKEVTVKNVAKKNHHKANPIFVSLDNRGMNFSRGTIDNLSAGYVKMLFNTESKQFAVVPTELGEGIAFMKPGKKTQIVRWTNGAVDFVRELLPENQKSNIRINGKIEDGIAIFDCNDLSERRKGATA